MYILILCSIYILYMAKTKVFKERRKQDEREKISDEKYAEKARKKNEKRQQESNQD